jgi:hypothetical protein
MTCLIRCANKLTKYLVPPNGWRGERVGEHLRKLRALLLGRAAAAEEKGKAPVPSKAAAEEKGKAPVASKAAAEEKGKAPVPSKAAAEEKGKAPIPSKAAAEEKGKAPVAGKAAAEEKGKVPIPSKAAAEEKGKAPVPKKAAAAINKPSGGAHDGASSEAVERAAASERSLALLAIDALEATLACATALGVPASLIHIEPRLTLPLEEWPSGMHLQVRALMASDEL